MQMILETIAVTEFATNCYLVVCPESAEAMVIDPGGEAGRILAAIERRGAKVKYIVATHGHVDHVGALAEIKRATGALFAVHSAEAALLADPRQSLADWIADMGPLPAADRFLEEGDELTVGSLVFRVLHTPGHTPGHLSLAGHQVAFVGDVLFFMGIGRTDFPGGDYDLLMRSIKEKLLPLGDEVRVYSGHGPATTIGMEREENPFLTGQADW